jgi:hypothetical protein
VKPRTATCLLLPLTVLAQRFPSSPGFRLGFTRTIYIDTLGTDAPSRFVRDQLSGAIVNRTKLTLVSDKRQADAVLLGTAVVTSSQRRWMVGHSSSAAVAAAAASPDSSVAAAAAVSDADFYSGSATVRIWGGPLM